MFRQEPYEGILCQNFFQSQKRILPSIKYFSLTSYYYYYYYYY